MLDDNARSQITLAGRLAAIEYMIGHLHKMVYTQLGATPEMVEDAIKQFRERLRTTTFPTFDPAMSDLTAGELQDAFDRLLDVIERMSVPGKKK